MKFVFDPDHTSAEFDIRHMMVTWVHGKFSKVTGVLIFDPADVSASSVEAEIVVASLSTGTDARDDDLRGPNYFDAEQYPTIAFKSTSVKSAGLDWCIVEGDLTIKGITRPAMLDVRYAGPSLFQDDDGLYTTYGFQATTTIDREDFGITRNLDIENGGFMVGKHARLTVNVEADLADE